MSGPFKFWWCGLFESAGFLDSMIVCFVLKMYFEAVYNLQFFLQFC